MQDVALGGISILCILTAIITGCNILSGDIQNYTIYTVMTKPVRRWEIVLGKSCGVWMLLAVNIATMGACFYLIALILGYTPSLMLVAALFFIFLEAVIIGQLAIFLSLVSQGYLSMAFALAAYVIGHMINELSLFCNASGSRPVILLSNILLFIFPNLESFDIKNQIVHGIGISGKFLLTGLSYSIGYIALVTFLSCLVFKTKEV